MVNAGTQMQQNHEHNKNINGTYGFPTLKGLMRGGVRDWE